MQNASGELGTKRRRDMVAIPSTSELPENKRMLLIRMEAWPSLAINRWQVEAQKDPNVGDGVICTGLGSAKVVNCSRHCGGGAGLRLFYRLTESSVQYLYGLLRTGGPGSWFIMEPSAFRMTSAVGVDWVSG